MYPDYLVHFNKNHSSKTGQFTYGDGDSDGQIDERHRYTSSNGPITGKHVKIVGNLGKMAAKGIYHKTKLGQLTKYADSVTHLTDILKDARIDSVDQRVGHYMDKAYDRVASVANQALSDYIGG